LNCLNKDHQTALIITCRNNISDVALAILEQGQRFVLKQVDNYGNTALMYAQENNMTEVITKITSYEL
jgi:ankyrin repeat protein